MARNYCITTKVHSSSIMGVLHSNPGSFLLLVKNLMEYQDVKVDWKLSWADLKVKLRKLFDTSEDAFSQFSMGSALITHASFEAAMEPLGLEAGLELQIRWAELDLDCNGDVSYDEFSTLVGTWGGPAGDSEALGNTLEVDRVPTQGSKASNRSPRYLQPKEHREMLRRRLFSKDAVGQVGAMLEKKLAESQASLERKFEDLAKQLLDGRGPGAPPEHCHGCFTGGRPASRKRQSRES